MSAVADMFIAPARPAPSAPAAAGPRAWARWRSSGDWLTLGVEEEAMLLAPDTLQPAARVDAVLAALAPALRGRISPETHASVVECKTGVHRGVMGAVAELAAVRAELSRSLAGIGLRAACAGTHPLASGESVTCEDLRYRQVVGAMRSLARREPTMALHIHVGVPEAESAVRVFNRLREAVPLLLALSANSPFLRGADSGFCSARTMLFGGFPRTGPGRRLVSYPDWVQGVAPLIDSGALPDPTFLWSDVRLQPALGTVELRVMDVQSTPEETAPLVALVQSLARLALVQTPSRHPAGQEVLEENRFLAARDGLQARLIDPVTWRRRPVRRLIEELIEAVGPSAEALGCAPALADPARLLAANGAVRQRAWARRDGPAGAISTLAQQFTR